MKKTFFFYREIENQLTNPLFFRKIVGRGGSELELPWLQVVKLTNVDFSEGWKIEKMVQKFLHDTEKYAQIFHYFYVNDYGSSLFFLIL